MKTNKYYIIVLEVWRKIYCFVIPAAITILYARGCFKYGLKVYESKGFTDALTALITFVSIIISFFGVLLTMLISIKETSELVRFFLKSIEKKDFVASIKRLIMWGLFTVILAIVLFTKDILTEKITIVISIIIIYSLLRFTTLTYRFTNILLSLFISDKKDLKKEEDKKLSDINKKELDKSLENFE